LFSFNAINNKDTVAETPIKRFALIGLALLLKVR